MAEKKEENRREDRVVPVRFRYLYANRYYLLTDKSGYPSAEYQFPNQGLNNAFIVRELNQ
ncbi:MAG: hypothetical protein K6U74_17865 [Firmicutes bacterium]|nr:hypothetical protein [Bacillota bacterium]